MQRDIKVTLDITESELNHILNKSAIGAPLDAVDIPIFISESLDGSIYQGALYPDTRYFLRVDQRFVGITLPNSLSIRGTTSQNVQILPVTAPKTNGKYEFTLKVNQSQGENVTFYFDQLNYTPRINGESTRYFTTLAAPSE